MEGDDGAVQSDEAGNDGGNTSGSASDEGGGEEGSGEGGGDGNPDCSGLPAWGAFVPEVGGLFPNIVGVDAHGDDLNLCELAAGQPFIIDISVFECSSCDAFAMYLAGMPFTDGGWDFATRASNFNDKMVAGTLGVLTIIAASYADTTTPAAATWEAKYPHDLALVVDASYTAPNAYSPDVCPNGWATFYYIDTDMRIIGYSHDAGGQPMEDHWGILNMANDP